MQYVALGSSFAAGPGIKPLVDRGAMRSAHNYPHLLAERLGLELTDVTCSSATTANLLDTPHRTLTGPRPPQVGAVGAGTELITITIGGNDLGYVGALMSAAATGARSGPAKLVSRFMPNAAGPVTPASDADVAALADALARLLAEIGRRAPRARVLLIDYLTLLGPDFDPAGAVPLDGNDADAVRQTGQRLEATLAQSATDGGAEIIRASEASRGHGLGSPDPWVTGLGVGVPWLGGAIPFHPNAAGMRAVADLIAASLSAGHNPQL